MLSWQRHWGMNFVDFWAYGDWNAFSISCASQSAPDDQAQSINDVSSNDWLHL